jgi:hypothetical protein
MGAKRCLPSYRGQQVVVVEHISVEIFHPYRMARLKKTNKPMVLHLKINKENTCR